MLKGGKAVMIIS